MNHHLTGFLCCFLLFVACSGSKKISIVSENEDLEKAKTERNVFLKEATFYGLQKDHFPKEIAGRLEAENANWVPKCPICDNVRGGLNMYAGSSFAAGKSTLSDAVILQLSSTDDGVRKTALRDLIDRYVQQYYSALKMTEEQRKNMQSQLEAGRKTGMGVANGGEGFFCSSCDGACHIKK